MAVLCAYLGGDLKRLRISVLLGSIVPLIALLVWDAIALSLSTQADQVVDPVELLMRYVFEIVTSIMKKKQEFLSSTHALLLLLLLLGNNHSKFSPLSHSRFSVKWSGVPYMVEAFSVLAVGTSITGTLLGFYEFFKEQLTNLSWNSAPAPMLQVKSLSLK